MQHWSRRRAAAVVVALTLAVAACGGTKKDSSSSSGATQSGSTSSSSAAAKPTPGGKVVYGLEADTAGGWCLPDAQLAISGIQVARAVYDTLTIQGAKPDQYVPYLAKSLTPSADYKTWTITLRPGIKFHDGTALDATVVKNNLDTYRGQNPAHLALLFRFVFDFIDNVTVTDPSTVVITTKVPYVDMPGALFASGRLGIMAQAQLDATSTCATTLIGTGPFKISSPITDTTDVSLVKNADYWQKDADGTQLPYLDAIEFRAIPEESQRLASLQNGTINLMHDDFGETLLQLKSLQDSGTVSLTTSDAGAEAAYLLLNSQTEPFNNQDARLALAYAFDFQKYNQLQNAGYFKQANGPFAPGTPGYLDDTGFPKFDMNQAKQHAAAYKAATGKDLSFTLTTTNETTTVRGAQIVQQMAKDAGINVDLANESQSQLINDAVAGKIQAFGWRNHPGGDGDTQYVWWHSHFAPTINFGKINDPALDAALDDGRSNPDAAARKKDYETVNKIFGAQAYNIWTYWTQWGVATSPNVHGIYGPQLPDGAGDVYAGLGVGHPVLGLYVSK